MDILVSLVVVLITLVIVAVVFAVSTRRRRALHQRLMAYCEQHHLAYSEEKKRLRRATVIRGSFWRLETGALASETTSDSGSSTVTVYTQWESVVHVPSLPCFRFGTVSGEASAHIPAAMPYISRLAGLDQDVDLVPVSLCVPLNLRFLLLASPETPADILGLRVERLMEKWPNRWALDVRVGPDGFHINIPGVRMGSAEDLDAVLALGEALWERFVTDASERASSDDKEDIQ